MSAFETALNDIFTSMDNDAVISDVENVMGEDVISDDYIMKDVDECVDVTRKIIKINSADQKNQFIGRIVKSMRKANDVMIASLIKLKCDQDDTSCVNTKTMEMEIQTDDQLIKSMDVKIEYANSNTLPELCSLPDTLHKKPEEIFEEQYEKLRELINKRDSREITKYLIDIQAANWNIKKLTSKCINLCFDNYAIFKEAIRCLDDELLQYLLINAKNTDTFSLINIIVETKLKFFKKRSGKNLNRQESILRSLMNNVLGKIKQSPLYYSDSKLENANIISLQHSSMNLEYNYNIFFDMIDSSSTKKNIKKSMLQCILLWYEEHSVEFNKSNKSNKSNDSKFYTSESKGRNPSESRRSNTISESQQNNTFSYNISPSMGISSNDMSSMYRSMTMGMSMGMGIIPKDPNKCVVQSNDFDVVVDSEKEASIIQAAPPVSVKPEDKIAQSDDIILDVEPDKPDQNDNVVSPKQPENKLSQETVIKKTTDFILRNNLLVKFTDMTLTGIIDYENIENDNKYEYIYDQLTILISWCKNNNNDTSLIVSILDSVSPKNYSEFLVHICSKGNFDARRLASFAKTNSFEKIMAFMHNLQIDFGQMKILGFEFCKQKQLFERLIYQDRFQTVMRCGTPSLGQLFSITMNYFDFTEILERFFFKYAIEYKFTAKHLHKIIQDSFSTNFILENIMMCFKIASYLPRQADGPYLKLKSLGPEPELFVAASNNYKQKKLEKKIKKNKGQERLSAGVSPDPKLELVSVEVSPEQNQQSNQDQPAIQRISFMAHQSPKFNSYTFERFPEDPNFINVPLYIIKLLASFSGDTYMNLYMTLMKDYNEIDSYNYSECLSASYNNGNYQMFEYLLDNPFTISYNDDNIIAILIDIAIRAFSSGQYNLLIKIFDKDLPDSVRIEIINKAVNKRYYDLFEILISKCPHLGSGFQKAVLTNLIKDCRFTIAESLLKRQDMTITNFYDFDTLSTNLINASNNDFLKEYVNQADKYKSEILSRLLNFKEKISDILTVNYQILKENLNSNHVDIDDNECIICYDTYANEDVVNILQCGHYLHKDCFVKSGSKVCPYCNIN